MFAAGHSAERPTASRRSLLAAVGSSGLAGISGCSRILGTSGGTGITLEYVEVAGARTKETFQPIVDELNAAYDDEVDLQFTQIPYENMRSQLQTRVGGGNAPDIAALDQIWLGAFVDAGVLLELDAVADDTDLDDFFDPFVETTRFDGHQYAFPTTTDVRGMYWNKAAFEDAGLDPESPPETWPELLDAAETLHDPPGRYGATQFVNGGRWTVNLFSAGGSVMSDDGTEPRFQESPGASAAAFLDDLYNGRRVGPPDPAYRNSAQTAREFLQGQYAITVVEGSWLDYFWRNLGNENPEMVERFGFAPTPRPAGGETATMSGGHVWTAFEDTDHPGVVRDFLRIATEREFMQHLAAEAGEIPTRESLQDEDEVWAEILYADTVRDILSETRLRPVRNWPVVADSLGPALQQVAFDEQAPETALNAAAEEVRSKLG